MAVVRRNGDNRVWLALSQLYDLTREIAEMRRRVESYREGMGVSGVSYDSTGGGGKTNAVSSPTENYALTDIALQRELKDMLDRQNEAKVWLVSFVNQVPDSEIRRISMLHFYDGLSWDDTAAELKGHAVGPSVRDRCKRYYDEYVRTNDVVVPRMLGGLKKLS